MVKQKVILEQAAQTVDFSHEKQSKNVPKQAFLNKKQLKTSKTGLFKYKKREKREFRVRLRLCR